MIKLKLSLFFIGFFLTLTSFAAQVIGRLDVVDPTAGCQGWGLDPDNPNATIQIHFYANAPAGTNGSVFIGSTIANLSRPDVNATTGYPGNHGFLWQMPLSLTTPCQILIYAYGIDVTGNPNALLSSSPQLMPLLTKTISSPAGGSQIQIKASSQYGGAIHSLIWNGKEFINTADHGRELQSASSFYNYANSWTAECYNPTEAGSSNDGNSSCTSSKLLNFTNNNNQLYTKTKMAFYAHPGTNTGTSSCPTPLNTTVLSDHIFEKTVSIGIPGIPHAFKYLVTYTIPQNETYLGVGQFETVTGYLKNELNTFYQYDEITKQLVLTSNTTSMEYVRPVVISTADGLYAMGVYTPQIADDPIDGQGYGLFPFPSASTYKWNVVRRIPNITPGSTYTFYS